MKLKLVSARVRTGRGDAAGIFVWVTAPAGRVDVDAAPFRTLKNRPQSVPTMNNNNKKRWEDKICLMNLCVSLLKEKSPNNSSCHNVNIFLYLPSFLYLTDFISTRRVLFA